MSVRLRPIRESDISTLEANVIGPEDTGHLQWFGYRTFHKMRQRFAQDGYLGGDSGCLIVDVDGSAAGWVSWVSHSWGPEDSSRNWTIGIILLPDFRGKGVGTAAQGELVDYLFAHTRVERIQASTDVHNVAERRSLEKAGFETEGILRKGQWRDGAWHDQVLYSIIRETRDI